MESAELFTTLMRWLPLLALALIGAVVVLSIRTYLRYRGKRIVTCPADGSCAALKVDATHAALTTALAWPELRVARCSRWPEKLRCGQPCLQQVEAAPADSLVSTIVSRWHRGMN